MFRRAFCSVGRCRKKLLTLAGMLRADKTAVICDLAETYGVLDYRALPVETLATLASGLRENSRIRMKLAGNEIEKETLLLAMAVDRLSYLLWAKTKDGQNGDNRPVMMVETLLGVHEKKETMSFDSGEAFESAREKIIRSAEWEH